jgi:hypothetical protein
MCLICRYFLPCPKDILNYYKSLVTQKQTKKEYGKIANEIWKTMTSSMVARAYLLAFRIMGRIIETKGDTDWLKNGAPHCNVRRDYVDTDRGVKKIEDVVGVRIHNTIQYTNVIYCKCRVRFKIIQVL